MNDQAEKVREALDQIAGELHLHALGEIEPGPAMESIDEAVLVLRVSLDSLVAELASLKDALHKTLRHRWDDLTDEEWEAIESVKSAAASRVSLGETL